MAITEQPRFGLPALTISRRAVGALSGCLIFEHSEVDGGVHGFLCERIWINGAVLVWKLLKFHHAFGCLVLLTKTNDSYISTARVENQI